MRTKTEKPKRPKVTHQKAEKKSHNNKMFTKPGSTSIPVIPSKPSQKRNTQSVALKNRDVRKENPPKKLPEDQVTNV